MNKAIDILEMSFLSRLISWMGWSRDDWRELFLLFHPIKLISWTGWTKDEYIQLLKKLPAFIISITMLLFIIFACGYLS